MIEVPAKYQGAFFGDFRDLRPSASSIPPYLNAFSDHELLPGTFHQIGPDSPRPEVRLRLASPDKQWAIDFETHRVSIEKSPTKPLGSNMGSPDEFAGDMLTFLDRILRLRPTKGTRLSLVTRGMMPAVPEGQMQDICRSLLRLPLFYTENPPFEWVSRAVARATRRISDREEELNVITTVRRVHGSFTEETGPVAFDRIRIDFDINTHQQQRDPRFDMAAVREFFPEALRIRSELLSQLKEHMHASALSCNRTEG